MGLDLNCDLGEGEPLSRTRALMRWVTSANIACGVHAGSVVTVERCVRLALDHGVRIGAHPGLAGNFGRREQPVTPAELQQILAQQVGGFALIARAADARLHHVKLHGALYHAVESDRLLARVYVDAARNWFPGVRLYVRAGGMVEAMAGRIGVVAWPEGFADRAYHADGRLVDRSTPGAVIHSVTQVQQQAETFAAGKPIESIEGTPLTLTLKTLCVHGDTPGAVGMARAVASALAPVNRSH